MLKSEVVQLDPKIRDGCQTLDEIIGEISEMKCLLHPCYIKAICKGSFQSFHQGSDRHPFAAFLDREDSLIP